MEELFEQSIKLINISQNILLISHRSPDADTLGSAISLHIWLSKLNKNTTLACFDQPSGNMSFLPHIEKYVSEFNLKDFDLIIIVDAGASYMTNFHLKYPDLFNSNIPIINIDHHASNDNFGKINIVDPNSASVTVIIYKMFRYFDVFIDSDMATCLLAGIYSDTGSFMHSNTNREVFKMSHELMNAGANFKDISKSLFKNNSITKMKLWGKVLENSHLTSDNVVMSVIKEDDYKNANATPDHLSGVIDYLNMVPNSKFAVLINEDNRGNVKGSFRTRNDDIDLSRIASVFGGGGHTKASGFSIPGKLHKEIKYTIVSDEMSKKSLKF